VTQARTVSELVGAGEAILSGGSTGVVLSTRLRLARNLAGHSFPGWANPAEKAAMLEEISGAILPLPELDGATFLRMGDLSDNDRLILVESHLISRELMNAREGSGAIIRMADGVSIMVNEEDHLRIQIVGGGLDLNRLYEKIDALDTALESKLDYAFSKELGYLTACPTNLGTALRASAMLHLPGLVLMGYMEQVIRAMNELGMVVRGHLGEGSEATGSFFQFSNQQTLGENEESILRRLGNALAEVIKQEEIARLRLLEEKGDKFLDKIGRARGILQNARLLTSEEAMDLLSLTRLAVDMNLLPSSWRGRVDALLVAVQPAHLQLGRGTEMSPAQRDAVRAKIVREEFAEMPALTHIEGEGQAG